MAEAPRLAGCPESKNEENFSLQKRACQSLIALLRSQIHRGF